MAGPWAIVLGVIAVFTAQVPLATSTPEVELGLRARKCWVFAHMKKSGGSSVKGLLQLHLRDERNISQGLYDSEEWRRGMGYAQQYLTIGHTITWGGYTEGLRPYGAQDCEWFTMFRQ